jgi:hypothetical protein
LTDVPRPQVSLWQMLTLLSGAGALAGALAAVDGPPISLPAKVLGVVVGIIGAVFSIAAVRRVHHRWLWPRRDSLAGWQPFLCYVLLGAWIFVATGLNYGLTALVVKALKAIG